MFSTAKTWARKSSHDYARLEDESEHGHQTAASSTWSKNQTKRQSTQSTKSTSTQSSLENYRGFLTERRDSLYDTPEQHNYFYDTVGERAAAGHYEA